MKTDCCEVLTVIVVFLDEEFKNFLLVCEVYGCTVIVLSLHCLFVNCSAGMESSAPLRMSVDLEAADEDHSSSSESLHSSEDDSQIPYVDIGEGKNSLYERNGSDTEMLLRGMARQLALLLFILCDIYCKVILCMYVYA